MGKCNQGLLTEHTKDILLYLHTCAFHLNMRYGRVLPGDFLDIVHQQKLKGIKIHVEDGESQSLQKLDDQQLHDFRERAKRHNLDAHIETSASDKATLTGAIRIAATTGATSVRFYPRHEGYLNDVVTKTTSGITRLSQYDDCGSDSTIEQREDLQDHELVTLANNSGMKSLSILLGSGNMINANEQPLSTLEVVSPLVIQVYIKDAKIIKEGRGRGHEAYRSRHGDPPMEEMLKALLLLGKDKPRVHTFGLEGEAEYYTPAFRFGDEGDDPWIPRRGASHTPLFDSNMIDMQLAQEKEHALVQIKYIHDICDKFTDN